MAVEVVAVGVGWHAGARSVVAPGERRGVYQRPEPGVLDRRGSERTADCGLPLSTPNEYSRPDIQNGAAPEALILSSSVRVARDQFCGCSMVHQYFMHARARPDSPVRARSRAI